MEQLYPWVQDYIGIPFVSGGRDRTGLDCYGLVRLILAEQYGYQLPILSGLYTNALSLAETCTLFQNQVPILTAEKLKEPETAAVALIQMRQLPCHLGLYCGDNSIIHSKYSLGAVIERVDSRVFPGKIMGWYRVSEDYCTTQSIQPRTTGMGM